MVGGRLFVSAGSRSGVRAGIRGARAGGAGTGGSRIFQNLGLGGIDGSLIRNHDIQLLGAHGVGWEHGAGTV